MVIMLDINYKKTHVNIVQQVQKYSQKINIENMTSLSSKSKKSISPNIIYIIADQSANIGYLYDYFGIEPLQDQATCLRFEIFNIPNINNPFQLYIFPRNRQIKSYCDLYLQALPKPNIVLYAIDSDPSIRQVIEWLNILQKNNQLKLVFFSSVRAYLQRQNILIKLNTLFLKDITSSMYFPNFDPAAFDNCFFNIQDIGISMRFYARTIPAFSRCKWIYKKIIDKFKKTKNQQYSSSSVI